MASRTPSWAYPTPLSSTYASQMGVENDAARLALKR